MRRISSSGALAVALAAVACSSSGCGGAAAAGGAPSVPPPPSPAVAAESDAVAACLAAAGAARARRPGEPATITVRHLLVKYAGAERTEPTVTRRREDACLRAAEARDKVRGGADFAEVVAEYSEEPGAASRGGVVGPVGRDDLAPAFADAAFELDVQQLSDVVETGFGFHVILRTD